MTEQPSPTDHGWLSVHVFYASNANPMLVECVQPLADQLRADGLINGFFFIKYWLEGPHVRLRFHPADGVDPQVVRAEVNSALDAFLKRRPALYEADSEGLADLYKQMYVAEYGEQRYLDTYGDGAMPMRPNNSYDYISYEREYGRYGGPAGIALSEWHFEHSSDIVLDLLATTNVHVRPVLLGLSTQLMMIMCSVFLDDEQRIADFLDEYRQFWETSYQESSDDYHDSFERSYQRMDGALRARLVELRRGARGEADVAVSGVEKRWLAHCQDLRARMADVVASGDVWFQRRDNDPTPTTDMEVAVPVLLSSYVHMTNNRLGVSILDEIYLSYLLRTALLDDLAGAARS